MTRYQFVTSNTRFQDGLSSRARFNARKRRADEQGILFGLSRVPGKTAGTFRESNNNPSGGGECGGSGVISVEYCEMLQ